MRSSVELGNPFAKPEQSLNQSDVEFIGDLLGPEAQQLFATLDTDRSGSRISSRPSEDFTFTEEEKVIEDLEKELPAGFWQIIDKIVADINQQTRRSIDPSIIDPVTEQYLGNEDLKLNPRQMQTFCDHILDFVDRISPIKDYRDTGKLFTEILNRSIEQLSFEKQLKLHLTIGENQNLSKLGFNWRFGTLELTAPTGDMLGFCMKGGRIICPETGCEAGTWMEGGTLEIGIAGDVCGESMRGGRIKVEQAGRHVGNTMDGGRIYVLDTAASYSRSRRGGHIFRPGGTEVAIGESQ